MSIATEGRHDGRVAVRRLVARILEGDGTASLTQRRAAFDNHGLPEPLGGFMNRVATQPTLVTEQDFAAARAADLSDDQLFELVICAAVGQAARQYESAIAALDAATDADAADGSHAT